MGLPGLSLGGNRQKISYRSIREEKNRRLTPRKATARMLEVVRAAVDTVFDRHVSDADIWIVVANKDFLPRTAQFLWKGLDAHRIGKYWTHIPECEDRAECQCCGTTEDLEHILIIWGAAKALWLERESRWPEVSLGTILGCDEGKPQRGTQRLYRILMSKSVYLIWKLRNNRVISRHGEPAMEDEIINKWKFAVNQKLQMDITLASRPTRGKRPVLAP
ncbi:hypothetical protein C8R44DRAFT_836556 [Mycena epipterygia]|nr:hypothetical protein C8R44DRAFT_836556 [Mycena epipterygia]